VENWELIGKKLSGEFNAEEAQRFESWLNSDISHRAMWEDAEKIWLATGKVDDSFEPDTEQALIKVKASREPGKIIQLNKFFTPLKIAAAVALIVIPVSLLILFTGEEKNVIAAAQKEEIPVPAFVKEKTITMSAIDSAISFYLPDHTHIYLNKHSSLVYPENFNLTARNVTLTGEAFFEVTPDAKKPFVIQAGNTETVVVGTSFNIKEDAQTKKVEVSVITGKVKFKVKKNSIHLSEVTLTPQDHVTYSESSATVVKRKVKGQENYWWVKNMKAIRKLLKNAKELTRPKRK
jgi:ferric-dicitrate binding protein FerR (iron transport regulator)